MRPSRPTILSILDPGSLLGRELVERLVQKLPDVGRRFFHTGSELDHLVIEAAGQPAFVAPLLDLDELDGSFAVALTAALPSDHAESLLAWLRANPDVRLIDCTQPGVAGRESSCVLGAPTVKRGARPWFHLADPALAGPARLLGALTPLDPDALHLTIVEPASAFGADAVEELAAQAAARLSGRTPRRIEHLPAVLAFDLVPASTERVVALESQLAELFPAILPHVQLANAGVFHGHLAAVQVRCGQAPTVEEVLSVVRTAAGMRLTRRNQRVGISAAIDRDEVLCSDVRVSNRWVSAWAIADGLRTGAAAAAVELMGFLLAS